MLVLLDTPEFYACFYGAMRIGAVPVPISTMMTPEDYLYFLNENAEMLAKFRTDGKIFSSPAVLSEDTVVCATTKGYLYFVKFLLK